jgi:DNA repair exonuclease SbcCD ATPase subunit
VSRTNNVLLTLYSILEVNEMRINKNRKQIMAAEVDGEDIRETIDDLADSVGEVQDVVEEVSEDNPDIEVDNNIANHFIAECDSCHGIFISAMVETDQDVKSVTGICPLCDKESDQVLKWIIKKR